MDFYPEQLTELMDSLRRLPGIGRRAAERLSLALLRWQPEDLKELGALLASLPERIARCPKCGNLSAPGELCPICARPGRDETLLCVVENFSQIAAIEKSGGYHGLYHVLGGRLSPLEGKDADDLAIPQLLERLDAGNVHELILALTSDVEGRATAVYLAERCKDRVEAITQLAQGLPAGADVAYADAATLGFAIQSRKPF